MTSPDPVMVAGSLMEKRKQKLSQPSHSDQFSTAADLIRKPALMVPFLDKLFAPHKPGTGGRINEGRRRTTSQPPFTLEPKISDKVFA
jgi:hypothetical protein